MRRDTLEYEYQLKASLEQQSLMQKKKLDQETQAETMNNFKSLLHDVEKDKRESRK
jgi:hypothetical protein